MLGVPKYQYLDKIGIFNPQVTTLGTFVLPVALE